LDHELVEYMAAIPSPMKMRARTTKHLLRKAASKYLPDKIVARRKQGFIFPIAYWFRGPLYPIINSFLMKSQFVQAGLFRKESVSRLLEEHRNNRVDHHVRLWMLLNLEIWHQLYIEQIDLPTVEKRLRQASQV
jgi:asparagine synthase (glutamine-hydrolysing)